MEFTDIYKTDFNDSLGVRGRPYMTSDDYSTLSNERAGWNKVCRLKNSAKFENFRNLKLYSMNQNYYKYILGQK